VVISGFVASYGADPQQLDAPDPLHVTGVAAGLGYALDVLEVTPFLDFQLGTLIEERAYSVDPQFVMSAGVDWIFSRHGSIGVAGHWHHPLPSGTGTFRVGPRLALRWP